MSWLSIDIEKRFADPAYQPEWTADDPPPWTLHNEVGKREFVGWLNQQLDEFARRVRAERVRDIEPVVPGIALALARSLATALPHLKSQLAWTRKMKPKWRVNEIVDRERLAEIRDDGEAEPGRPASGVDWETPTALAARDIWRLRKIILPRFKPKAARPGMGLTNDVVASVAADRQNARLAQIAAARKAAELPVEDQGTVTADAALNWYKNERLAKF